jgi:Fur family ferric uptake transcriptional regulator
VSVLKETQAAWPAGIRKTKQRRFVLALLDKADAPLSASEIFDRVKSEDAAIWLSTVYRILDRFAGEGLVVKTTVADGGAALYARNRNRHRHYAVCVNCRRIVGLENCPMESFEPKLTERDFRVLGHRVEMYGYCRDCDKKLSGAY